MTDSGWNKTPDKTFNKNIVPSKARVSLDIEKFDALIKQQGVRVKIFRTLLCPNVKSIDGGEHEIDCPLCSNGYVDTHPEDSWAFIQTQGLDKNHFAEGYYDGNTVVSSFLAGVELQYFTLIQLPDFTDTYIDRVKRQQGKIDHLKYKATNVNVVMDKRGKEYFQGNDFCLDANGSIKWKANKGPLTGEIYSVHYECCVQFRALKAMHVNRFAQDAGKSEQITMSKAQEQWLLQKEFLVNRVDSLGEALVNKIRDPDEP